VTGKVLIAFRNLPLPMHAFAEKAAEAGACAGREGRFWALHDRLFADQQHLDEASLVTAGTALGLDGPRFTACLGGQTAAAVAADAAQAKAWGVTGTPTFFLGVRQADGRVKVTQRFSGALPAEQFTAAIERVLATAPAGQR
jgi:protein-disulfide isomerase